MLDTLLPLSLYNDFKSALKAILNNSSSNSPSFMTLFNLATCNESSGHNTAPRRVGRTARKYSLPKRHVRLSAISVSDAFLFRGWLVVPRENQNELVWFDNS